jgi:hypothetical protein
MRSSNEFFNITNMSLLEVNLRERKGRGGEGKEGVG